MYKRQDLDEARSIERHFFSLYPDCVLRTPAKSELSRAVSAAVCELMDARYPRHPYFDPGDRAVTTGQLEKAFEAYERVCAHADQRLPVAKRELGEYTLPEKLHMLDLSDAHVGVRPRFQQDVDKSLRAQGIETPTVRQVKNALDTEGVRGPAEEVRDFEVLCYALVSHRELMRDGRPVSDVKLGKLGANWELVKAPLPAMAAWTDAVERAGTLFGIGISRALNVNNLRTFSEKLTQAVQKAVQAKPHELVELLSQRAHAFEAAGPRLETAKAVAELLVALQTNDPVAQVEALASATPRTSLTAMQKHLTRARETLSSLEDEMRFAAFEALQARPEAGAAALLLQVREALSSDELNQSLSTKLSELGLSAQRLLTGHREGPPKREQEPMHAILAEARVEYIAARDAAASLEQMRTAAQKALEEAGPTARLSFEWRVTKG